MKASKTQITILYYRKERWSVMAEWFSASDLCSDGWVVRMWVRILAVTVVPKQDT